MNHAKKIADFFEGWSRTAQSIIGLATAVGIILTSIFTFANRHAEELMSRAVVEVSDRIEQQIIVTHASDSTFKDQLGFLLFTMLVRQDSITNVTQRLNQQIDGIRENQIYTRNRLDAIWRKLNQIPEPTRQELEMDSLRKQLTGHATDIRENRRIDSLHRESIRKAIEKLEPIQKGDRAQ